MKYIAPALLLVSSIACGQVVDTSNTSILNNLNNGVNGATQVQMTDLKQTQVDLGFDFPFYGETYSAFIINANGWVGFGVC